MSKIFEDTMQGLLEAVAVSRGEIPIIEKENMPAPTFIVADNNRKQTTNHCGKDIRGKIWC